MGAVGSGEEGEDVEGEWREILKRDDEGERRVEEMSQLVHPFPPACLWSCVSGPGLFHLQLSQLNGAAALLSVVENETG